jgi:hypothetical protein
MRTIKPLYDARRGDLEQGDFVKIECRCGRTELVPGYGLADRIRLPPYTPVLNLETRLRCKECDQRGKVVLSIQWAE